MKHVQNVSASESDALVANEPQSSRANAAEEAADAHHHQPATVACRRFLTASGASFIVLALILVAATSNYTPIRSHFRATNVNNRDDVATETMGLSNSAAPSRFKATQFISFTINTMGGVAKNGECEGKAVDNNGVCYLGNAANLTEDVLHRLKLVENVLNVLKNDEFRKSPEINHNNDVLKIFMMPEFFLRGPYGAYSTTDLFEGGILLRLADRIHELIADPEFSDYLFVFGTVIAARNPNDPLQPWENVLDPKEIEYYNFAPVYRGGPNHKRFLVTKRYISLVDFLDRSKLPNPASNDVRLYGGIGNDFRAFLKGRDVELVEDNDFEIDGLKIGLEICLDHRLGMLWSNLQKDKKELVDVLLITSAGMAIERGPNPVVPGGVVYLSDGEASSAACLRSDNGPFDPKEVCRSVELDGLQHIPHGGSGFSEFFIMSGCIDMEREELLEGYYSLYQTQGCAYTLKTYGIDVFDEFVVYPPSLEIYPTVDLPKDTYDDRA